MLDQRIRSIEHYQKEIGELKDTLKVVEATKNDLVKSIADFFPFEPGDIVMTASEEVVKVLRIEHSHDGYDGLNIKVVCYPCDGGNFNSRPRDYYYKVSTGGWTLIKEAKKETE